MQAVVRSLAPAMRAAGRRAASGGVSAQSVQYKRFGEAADVCSLEAVPIPDKLGKGEVLIKMIAAPVTEFDASFIAGFGSERAGTVFPATGGNEGVGIVEGVGDGVSGIKEGDHVMPTVAGVGTWATHTVAADTDVVVVPAASGDAAVALSCGVGAPAMASALLQFAEIKDGDVIVQTNAQSPVGQVITQMAAERGAAVVNILSGDHPDYEELALHLQGLNPAGICVRDTTAASHEFATLLADLPEAVLVVDGAGGAAAIAAAGALQPGGTMVTYANASRKPVVLPMPLLLQKGIVARGFNLDGWAREVTPEQRRKLARSCAEATVAGKYSQLLHTEPLEYWHDAVKATRGPISRRTVLQF